MRHTIAKDSTLGSKEAKTNRITQAIENIQQAISRVESKLSSLETRIQPVTIPGTPTSQRDSPVTPTTGETELERQINEAVVRLSSMSEWIGQLTERVDL